MANTLVQRLRRVAYVLSKAAEGDPQVMDKSTHPTVVQYALEFMKKGKTIPVAAKLTAERLSGGTNVFLGNGIVSIDAKVLEEAIWDKIVEETIRAMKSYKPEKQDMAIGGTLQMFGQAKGPMMKINPKLEAELRKRVIKKLGHDPFVHTARTRR
jgi:hypothetical protein